VLRLAVRVRRGDAELVLAELLALVPSGVEEVDVDDDTVEFAVYGAPGEIPELPALQAAAADALVEVTSSEIADDWAERWREFHRPLVLGDRLSVRPPWEPQAATELDIVIDPGRAFGTGAHATTRLCLELLLDLPVPGAGGKSIQTSGPVVVDLGCGSGVLGIAAARLGWGRVLALDNDPLSVEATTANASVNGVADLLAVRRFDLRSESVPPARLVFANLLRPLLLQWSAALHDRGSKLPSIVIASGLLVDEADAIAAAFAELGLRERRRRNRGDWAALLLVLNEMVDPTTPRAG
jgi:ribosomal protein L11 methyltransferase